VTASCVVQADVAALFAANGVSLYFAGHSHSYSRFSADMYNDSAVHIVVGGAG